MKVSRDRRRMLRDARKRRTPRAQTHWGEPHLARWRQHAVQLSSPARAARFPGLRPPHAHARQQPTVFGSPTAYAPPTPTPNQFAGLHRTASTPLPLPEARGESAHPPLAGPSTAQVNPRIHPRARLGGSAHPPPETGVDPAFHLGRESSRRDEFRNPPRPPVHQPGAPPAPMRPAARIRPIAPTSRDGCPESSPK